MLLRTRDGWVFRFKLDACVTFSKYQGILPKSGRKGWMQELDDGKEDLGSLQ